MAYDTHFRQQVVGNQSADRSKLNQSLYAVTFVAQGEREKCRNCMLCLESDHTEEQCALYVPPQKAPKLANPGRRSGNGQTTSESRDKCHRAEAKRQPHGLHRTKEIAASRRANVAMCVCAVLGITGHHVARGSGVIGRASPETQRRSPISNSERGRGGPTGGLNNS